MKIEPQDYSEWSFPQLQPRFQELLQQIQETDQQGLPVDELFVETGRVLAMMDLLVEVYQKGQPFYAGWWESRQVKDEPPVLPLGERSPDQRIDVPKRVQRIAEFTRRRKALADGQGQVGDEELLTRQLHELGCAAGEPDVQFDELWTQHEFHWLAHMAELRRSIVRQCAHIMLAFEDIERTQPDHFHDQPNMIKMLDWWRNEGGREEYLGQITLEERRNLEAMARQWREKNP